MDAKDAEGTSVLALAEVLTYSWAGGFGGFSLEVVGVHFETIGWSSTALAAILATLRTL